MMQEDQYAYYGSRSPTTGSSQSTPADLTTLPEPPNPYEANTTPYSQPLMEGPPAIYERKKNFPPCKPIVHHDIKNEIPTDARAFVRKAYFGWYVHIFCILYNFICMLGAVIKMKVLIGFFISLAILLLGAPISFFVYLLLYKGIRQQKSSLFCLWFGFFVLQMGIELLYAIGISSTGGVGLILMLDAFTSDLTILGVMFGISFGLWLLIFFYNVWFFNQARVMYKQLGGLRATTKEFTKSAVNTAYDNRGTIKDFAVEHKDTIKQVARDNKDLIFEVAQDNKEVIAQVAYENRGTIARAAVENKDMIFENQDIVSNMFDGNNNPKQQ